MPFGRRTVADPNERAVALRAGFRAFPGLAGLGFDTYWREAQDDKPLLTLLAATRALFVAWAELVYDGVRPDARREAAAMLSERIQAFDAAVPHFYADHSGMNDYGIDAMQQNVEAARRALSWIAWGAGLAFARPPGDSGKSYVGPFDTLARFGPTGRDESRQWAAQQSAAIDHDRALVEQGLSARALIQMPLWPDRESEAREIALADLDWFFLSNRKRLGLVIAAWLKERRPGALVLGRERQASEERVVRTANLPRSFWEGRSPDSVLDSFDYCLNGSLDNENWGLARQGLSRLG